MNTDEITKEKIETDNITNNPKVLVLCNDDYNTFDHVHKCLVNICKMDIEKAWNCTVTVHTKGKCVVAEGSDDHLKKIKLRLRAEGLSVTIEDA